MYIDPNSGGMLFQVLAIMFGTLSAIVLFFSGRIRLFLARFRRSGRESAAEESGTEGLADVEGESTEE